MAKAKKAAKRPTCSKHGRAWRKGETKAARAKGSRGLNSCRHHPERYTVKANDIRSAWESTKGHARAAHAKAAPHARAAWESTKSGAKSAHAWAKPRAKAASKWTAGHVARGASHLSTKASAYATRANGFIYQGSRLVCDLCGTPGATKQRCPFGYCPSVDACANCRKTRKDVIGKAAHRAHGCEQRMEESRAREAVAAHRLASGGMKLTSAFGSGGTNFSPDPSPIPSGHVRAAFRGADGRETSRTMPKSLYDARSSFGGAEFLEDFDAEADRRGVARPTFPNSGRSVSGKFVVQSQYGAGPWRDVSGHGTHALAMAKIASLRKSRGNTYSVFRIV